MLVSHYKWLPCFLSLLLPIVRENLWLDGTNAAAFKRRRMKIKRRGKREMWNSQCYKTQRTSSSWWRTLKKKLKRFGAFVLNTVVPHLWLWRPFRRKERGSREEERDKLNNIITKQQWSYFTYCQVEERSGRAETMQFISKLQTVNPPGLSHFLLLRWKI